MKKLTTSILTLSLGLTFTSSSFAQKMYWSETGTNKIQRADLDGSNVEDLVTGLTDPGGLALDLTNSKIYWSDYGTDKIQRSDLDGSNIEDLVTTGLSFTFGLALDVASSKMYWSDAVTQKIQRSNLDGSSVEDLVTGLNFPHGMTLDLTNSKIYWADAGTGKLQRSDLDGSNVEDIVTGISSPFDVKLDLTNSKIYWAEGGTGKIQRSDLDGSNEEDLVTGLNNLFGIALDLTNSKIYWTDTFFSSSKIQRSDLDGSNVEDLVTTGLNNPFRIDLDTNDAPLSVELNSFSARQIENSIQLTWSTASETENEGFNIYRKTGESDFVQIASYKSHSELVGQGNTSFQTNYSFVDNSKLQNGETYTYVISDVETNGLETKHEENERTVKFALSEEISQTKLGYVLAQNFPNPFNPSTTISYQIAIDSRVSLKVYNEKGEFVKELTNGFQHEGSHNAVWNGTDENGKSVSSGTYFYKLTAGTFTQTNKMILLK